MNDAQNLGRLVEAAQRGERQAQEEIYERFAPRILNFLFRLVGSREDAEDIAQQTFLIVLRQLGSLRDPAQLESWIYRIARNEVYQRFRKRKAASLNDEDFGMQAGEIEEPGLQANPERALLNLELRRVLQAALADLPWKLREVFVLAVIQGKTYQEVTGIVSRSLLSVKTDIYRARLQMRGELRKYLGREQKSQAKVRGQ